MSAGQCCDAGCTEGAFVWSFRENSSKRQAKPSLEFAIAWRPRSLMDRVAELERQRAEAEKKKDEKAD
jgi:hypothetical protein